MNTSLTLEDMQKRLELIPLLEQEINSMKSVFLKAAEIQNNAEQLGDSVMNEDAVMELFGWDNVEYTRRIMKQEMTEVSKTGHKYWVTVRALKNYIYSHRITTHPETVRKATEIKRELDRKLLKKLNKK